MLSISNIRDTKAAGEYYESEDDYYADGERSGLWFGAGAKTLGWEGCVARDDFVAALDGRLPDGIEIHNAGNGHRCGVDLTFSPSKSVSLMALLAGDKRIVNAHETAVARTLSIAETMVGCRVTISGETIRETTGNLIAARFTHDLSRACDPQLHTHCVVLNATRRSDGKWRAMDNEPFYRAKMLLGAAYRAELAKELKALGYSTTLTHIDGRFEIEGFDQLTLKEFSKRSQAMEEYLKDNKELWADATAIEKKQAVLATREKKSDVDRDELAGLWQQRIQDLGVTLPDIPLASITAPEISFAAESAVERAINHLSERESAFTIDQVTCAALQFGTGETTYPHVINEVQKQLSDDKLRSSGRLMTTPALQAEERKLLQQENEERQKLPVLSGLMATAFGSTSASQEQLEAVHHIVSSDSRMIGIIGKAGTGKTTTLKIAVDALHASGVKTFGVAPSSQAAKLLHQTGVETSTVAGFLTNSLHTKLGRNGVLIVDEAGMLSTKQLAALLDKARQHEFRLVLVGDPAQLAAVEAGKPLAQLIAANMPTVKLQKIHRQKNKQLKQAVEFASEGQIKKAIKTIQKRVIEMPDRAKRLESIAEAFVALTPDQRSETIVVAGTRASREKINRLVREKLGIAGTGMVMQALEKRDLTKQQVVSIASYEAGDVLVAERDYKSIGMGRGQMATVKRMTATSVILKSPAGQEIEWRPALIKDLSAYRLVEREIAVNDEIRVTANMHSHGLLNGDTLRVAFVDGSTNVCVLQQLDGTRKTIDLSKPLPIDYSYCRTVYASQGATCDRVLIEADTSSLTANRSTFYVAISRARQEVSVFTDNADSLTQAMDRSSEKNSALDVHIPEELSV